MLIRNSAQSFRDFVTTAVVIDVTFLPTEPRTTADTSMCILDGIPTLCSTNNPSSTSPTITLVSSTTSASTSTSHSGYVTTSSNSSTSWQHLWYSPTSTVTQSSASSTASSASTDNHSNTSSGKAKVIAGATTGAIIGFVVVLLALYLLHRKLQSRRGSESMSKKEKTSQMSNFGEDREQYNNVEDSQRSMIPTSTPSLIEGGTNITTSSIPEVALLQADIERQRLRLIEIERNEERTDWFLYNQDFCPNRLWKNDDFDKNLEDIQIIVAFRSFFPPNFEPNLHSGNTLYRHNICQLCSRSTEKLSFRSILDAVHQARYDYIAHRGNTSSRVIGRAIIPTIILFTSDIISTGTSTSMIRNELKNEADRLQYGYKDECSTDGFFDGFFEASRRCISLVRGKFRFMDVSFQRVRCGLMGYIWRRNFARRERDSEMAVAGAVDPFQAGCYEKGTLLAPRVETRSWKNDSRVQAILVLAKHPGNRDEILREMSALRETIHIVLSERAEHAHRDVNRTPSYQSNDRDGSRCRVTTPNAIER
ncbi:uncharacterized protein STEHIDRAFT_116516 [Stereum hirsutum FP-91666 SS1]|uniref:Uncharacterized protein n=1 Tax=Stereum hirsutum (strain FP-91666) TaxID=721885 RepID=R7RXC1_STEHR|nr:uncharacterized protein STEHIDRAFT_116516 [Stereum hirsutum FP-91666 SS1]EIM79468.1 hypothetical protein STEHIDRAFT_116516 [Stereum hirsutum FP-91666 SS1]